MGREDRRAVELEARASIQRGETGDKIPGFDPAAAPMETDAEAGVATSGGIAGTGGRRTDRPPETSTASAMRGPEPAYVRRRGRAMWVTFAAAALVTTALLLALVTLIG